MIRKSLTVLALSIVSVGALTLLSGCSASPISTASFIVGAWGCDPNVHGKDVLYVGFGLDVYKDGRAVESQFVNRKLPDVGTTYHYSVGPGKIETNDSLNGGGWNMVIPMSVTAGKRYIVKIDGLNGSDTHETPTVTIKDATHISISTLYGKTYDCSKVRLP